MKITVIGAGHGGLQAAKELSENGYDVTIYEKNSRENLSYDWYDDVENTVFSDLNIPLPKGSSVTEHVSFVGPFCSSPLKMEGPKKTRERHIDRHLFALLLCERAEKAGAKIFFDTNVDALIFNDNNDITGIEVNGKEIKSDLVIDSSGVNSPFRESLPEEIGITGKINDDDTFKVYRAFMNKADNSPIPEKYPKKLYLKHIGERGISWCIYEPDGLVNILIGRVGKMSDSTLKNAMNKLKEDNPIIGDTLIRGGDLCVIPIRRPLSKMVTKGYVAIGDAAFMTMPLIGSGISNSLRAGNILAETIINNKSVSLNVLWQYQVEYYKTIGAEHYFIDILKTALLNADSEDIKYIFECGIITEEELKTLLNKGDVKPILKDIFSKFVKIIKKPMFVSALLKAAIKGIKAQSTAKNIPFVYDEKTISVWQKKCESYFK